MSGFERLSPMDSFRWFQPPIVTFFPMLGSVIQVAQMDPMRVLLIFSVVDNSSFAVFSPTIEGANLGGGICVTPGAPFLVIDQAKFGMLAQSDWFAFSTGSANISVTALALRDWPEEGVYNNG